jgi:hypothetical protein
MWRHAVIGVAAGLAAAVLAAPAGASTSPPLVFSMSSGESSMVCKATSGTATPVVTATSQSCTITQHNGGTAWCIQRKSARGPTTTEQTCTIKQTSTTRANVAYVVQVAEHRGGTSPQETTQIATVEQGNQFKTNTSSIAQTVKQALGRLLDDDGDDNGDDWRSSPPEEEVTQIQNARQLADVCQGATSDCALGPGVGMLSHNDSKVRQEQWQSEQAAATVSITQEQNSAVAPTCALVDGPANMCADVDQNTQVSGAGRNKEGLEQLYVQLQNARGDGDTTMSQQQGGTDVFTGGLEHEVVQHGGGVANITTGQNTLQIQKAAGAGAGTLFQKQDPKVSKGHLSDQSGAAGTRWTGVQRAFQFQVVDGKLEDNFQRAQLTYDGVTTGTISAKQLVNQNGQVETNSCSGMFCSAFLDCTNVEESTTTALNTSVVLFQSQACFTTPP